MIIAQLFYDYYFVVFKECWKLNEKGFVNYPADRMDDQDDVLSYLKLDPDHHEKIAALIPKVGDLYLHVM